MRLYLASTSPARLATLRAVGVEPILIAPGVDEEAVTDDWVARNGPISAERMVELLARAKAEAVIGMTIDGSVDDGSGLDSSGLDSSGTDGDVLDSSGIERGVIDGFILGGDSAFELDGAIYGKPHLPEVARERWLLQRGRTGHLHSGHWLIDHRGGVAGDGVGAVTTSAVTFASNISDDEIDAYIATGEPLKVAGAFTIDSLGAPFITSVVGDPHAVVGLSVATLRQLLLSFGVSWPTLWNRSAL